MDKTYSLMLHGGAGTIPTPEHFIDSITSILDAGDKLLRNGGDALDVTAHCVELLENDPLYNAGVGSVLTNAGIVELDAAIMDGATLEAGAIAGVRHIKNPIKLARAVMEKSEHVFLIGDGAKQFARDHQIELAPDEYFLTQKRVEQLTKAQQIGKTVLDHSETQNQDKMGTVGCIARDTKSNLAAATSTGGTTNKKYGRVGDSPVIGSGTFADNEVCAVSASGYGEHFLRTVLAKTIAGFVEHQNMNAQQAADAGIKYLVRKVNGLGGVIVIDHQGNCARALSSPGMITGKLENGKQTVWGR